MRKIINSFYLVMVLPYFANLCYQLKEESYFRHNLSEAQKAIIMHRAENIISEFPLWKRTAILLVHLGIYALIYAIIKQIAL